jgi:CHASE3 domain sensor protein
VHQIVRDRTGKVLSDQVVKYVYEMQDGLVRRMEIRT